MEVSWWLLQMAWLPWMASAQDTGGFYIGPPSINRESDGQCMDNKGQGIPEGLLFTPGPDECQVCTCLMKMPVLCRTVLCAPPKNCLSLRVGDACCQWICDEWDTPRTGGNDIGLRLVASAITAVFSLALLFFLIYRLRQRKLRGRQNHLEAESYNSAVGEQEDCWAGDSQVSALPSGWIKGNSFTRPFPPTYDEAMQSGSTDATTATSNTTTSPGWMEVDPEIPAPPYNAISQDPIITYPAVATMGRLVLPPGGLITDPSSRTLPAVLRRMRRVSGPHRTRDEGGGHSECNSENVSSRCEQHQRRNSGEISENVDGTRIRVCGSTSSDPDRRLGPLREFRDPLREASVGGPPDHPQPQLQRYSYLSQSDFPPDRSASCQDSGRSSVGYQRRSEEPGLSTGCQGGGETVRPLRCHRDDNPAGAAGCCQHTDELGRVLQTAV